MTNLLFVCTGNTCRSPMAEYLMRELCESNGLQGISVLSAGTSAFSGDDISFYSREELASRGIDASAHRSRCITQELLQQADYVITMTEAQKHFLQNYCQAEKLLSMRDILGEDIADPYGRDEESYARCAEQIEKGLKLFIEKYLQKEVKKMRIPIASDHAAFAAKAKVIEFLKAEGYEPVDMGCYSEESVHYPEYGAKVAEAVSSGEYEKGILLCGTGIGMSLVANKFPGVRATLCHNAFTAQACREHNDSNVLVMGARVLTEEQILEITKIWLETEFAGGRHSERLAMITAIEEKFSKK